MDQPGEPVCYIDRTSFYEVLSILFSMTQIVFSKIQEPVK